MLEKGKTAEEEDVVTTEELTDFAFGMFTVFAEQSLAAEGNQLFSAIDADDASPVFATISAKFTQQYPMLAEPLAMFGSTEDFLDFYRYGEAVVPTKTTHTYWIWQMAPGVGTGACSSEEAGKWLIFLPPADADDAWMRIRDATVSGELGIGAKVSTARENPNSRDDRTVIYVFTKDWADKPDVMRVREALKNIGFSDRIGYKRNIDTYAGEYRKKGKRVTYYFV